MANGDGAAIDVYLADVEFEIADRCDRLGRKSFVDLDHVNIVGIKAGARQRLARSKDRSQAHGLRFATGHGNTLDAHDRVQTVLDCVILRTDQGRCCTVSQGRRCTGCDTAVLVECQLESGKVFYRSAWPKAAIALDYDVAELNWNDLVLQSTSGLCVRRFLLTQHGELFLLFPGDAVFSTDVFGGFSHRHVCARYHFMQDRVGHRIKAAHCHPAHRLNAGADKDFAGTHLDRAGRIVNGLH